MSKRYISRFFFLLAAISMSTALIAGQLEVPNQFNAGEPAVAADVNENFSAAATAINDNDSRVSTLESSLINISDRLAALEGVMPGVLSFNTYYGTDLIFVTTGGDFIIPFTDEAGQQSVPTSGDAVVRNTGFEFNALPGQDTVSFEVLNDNTLVVFQSFGSAYNSSWNTKTIATVALRINGVQPEIGASEKIVLIGDDNLSGDTRSWHITYTTTLNAGTHTFSVLVQGDEQSQSSLSIDGRSTEGWPGRVKTSVMQIKMPE